MEDIYGDLDNYEDVNALQELRSENKELKLNLELKSTAMEKLQKDYDTLEIEFKKLENNYSSLLKTARSEIQRKTERITQLNTEKDMMVLNALKSGKYIRRSFNQGVRNPGRNDEPGRRDSKKNKDFDKPKNVDTKQDRRESPVLPNRLGTCDKNKSDNAYGKVEITKKSDVIENIARHKTDFNEVPMTSAGSIRDRRKSVPAVSMPIEMVNKPEQNFQTKDNKSDTLPTDMYDWRYKTSETSSIDDQARNPYEYTSRDNNKGKSSRNHDNSLYKGRDKYEFSLKYRKQTTPERVQKRQYREQPGDYHRHERNRYHGRSLESPPHESYKRHSRRKPDHRSDYDRCSRDYDKNRYHYDEHSARYRPKDIEEPQLKRQRTNSYGNPDAHFKEDRRPYCKRDSMETQPMPDFSPHEYEMLRFSCQSPDFEHTDAVNADPKEIMATAATPLEDPRVTSKRYVILKENGKEILSTAVGRNLDVRPVNKAVWNIKPVDIPVALVHRPPQCSSLLVKDIYNNIDNPVQSNLDFSTELGEVLETDDETSVIRSKPKEIQHDTQEFVISKEIKGNLSKPANNAESISKLKLAEYRIPKIGHTSKNTQRNMDVPIIELDDNVQHHKNDYKKAAPVDGFPEELFTHKHQNNERKKIVPNVEKYCKIECNKNIKSREKGEDQNRKTYTKIATVADDLELSDDNIDHMDTNRKVTLDKLQNNCDIPLNHNEAKTDDFVNNVKNKTLTSSQNTDIERTVETSEIQDFAEEDKTKESNSTKKHKTKKKKSKSKEISKVAVEITGDAIDVSEKKSRSKKDRESKPKETKEMFSDLFGDSSSLMTPEDLGIPSYLPISEDAQDAVDLKIDQIIDSAPRIDINEVSGDPLTQSRVLVEVQKEKPHEEIPKAVLQKSIADVEHKKAEKQIQNKKSSIRNEEMIDTNQLPSPIVYENLNPGTDLNDPNVVKTVIISSGIQPAMAFENKIEGTKPSTDVQISAIPNTKDLFPATKEFKRDILKALATSTPHKELSAIHSIEADDVRADVISDPCVSKAVGTSVNAEEQVANQTENNTLESNDAPDVRIFVKRRRKVLKRPLMT